jgi:pyruvyl transferase EpsO
MCARDKVSYEMLKGRSLKNVLLVPDMAFCINMRKWDVPDRGGRDLLLKRMDGEFKDSASLKELEKKTDIDISDWPTMLPVRDKQTKYMLKFRNPQSRRTHFLADYYAYHVYRKHLIKTGVSFLRAHKMIYTTRLHTAILSVLLDKKVYFFDNSYGKNKNFYDTWLYDCENITMVEND